MTSSSALSPTDALHPDVVLIGGEGGLSSASLIPCVDHYAGSAKLIGKSLALQAEMGPVFDITCDCEDGAAVGEEAAHVRMVAANIMSSENRFGRVGARIHPLTHPHWLADLRTLVAEAGERIAFVTLPKPRNKAEVRTALAALRELEHEHGLAREIPMHVLIETHGALREVWDIAALPGVASLDFGLMDFVSAHEGAIDDSAMRSPGQFEHRLVARAKTEIAAAALARGKVPTHNVCTDIANPATASEDALRARHEFGFLRMWSIHPSQIVPILEAMRPSHAEVQTASDILLTAVDNRWGPIRHNGRLHDRASYRYFWITLKRAYAAGVRLPGAAHARFFSHLPESGLPS